MTQIIESRVRECGTLTIEPKTTACGDRSDNCDCGAYAHYHHLGAPALHEVASRHDWVERPNGRLLRGAKYTKRMAQNDFRSFAREH